MTVDNVKILNQLDENAQGSVPIGHRIRREMPCKEIF